MDSGGVVPTLNPGLSDTVAEKLFTVASGRWDETAGATLLRAGGATGAGAVTAESMLFRRARFLAVDKAGRSIAAKTAMIAMTTMSSMSVKARLPVFILHLEVFFQGNRKHGRCQGILRAKCA